jgi:hypothetical protein
MRQMVMVGVLQAQNCTNLVSSWRHRESRSGSTSADYYQTIGRVLEEGKFHAGFFDDRLAIPDRYGNNHRHTVGYGVRCEKWGFRFQERSNEPCPPRHDRSSEEVPVGRLRPAIHAYANLHGGGRTCRPPPRCQKW